MAPETPLTHDEIQRHLTHRPRRSRIPGKRRRSHIRLWSRQCGTPCSYGTKNYVAPSIKNLLLAPKYTVVLTGPTPPWPCPP